MTTATPAHSSAASRAALLCLLASAITLFAGFALAQQAVPALNARVTDLTGTLESGERKALEQRLLGLEKHKGSQIAVLIVPTTEPEDITAYGIRVADAWKLGREDVDDGVILIVAKSDRRVRIEVGQGLEGAIPDAAAARIIREYITPRFREGDFAGGINDAVGVLIDLINGVPLPAPLTDEPRQRGDDTEVILSSLFVAFIVGSLLAALSLGVRGIGAGTAAAGTAWLLGGLVGAIFFAAIAGAIIGMIFGGSGGGGRFARRGGSGRYGGWGGGGWGGGSSGGGFGGGGFSGGGGGFSGGGASGSW